jgi:hypothetical protein
MFTEVHVAPLNCTIANLRIESPTQDPDEVIRLADPAQLKLTVNFSGAGATLLVAAKQLIKVSFYAESIGPGPEVALGDAVKETQAGVFSYDLVLNLPSGLGAAGLTADMIYRIGSTMKVSTPSFDYPSWANGFIEGLSLQVFP